MRLLFFLFFMSMLHFGHAQVPAPPDGYKWTKNDKFSDEFNGNQLDSKKWYDRSPYWVNGRPPATFRAEMVTVADGNLMISNAVLKGDEKYNIQGGAVASVAKDGYFGYYEARIKASSISMSTTFWMKNKPVGRDCPREQLELDIVEIVGQRKRAGDFRTTMKSNAHTFHWDCDKELTVKSAPGPGAVIDPPADEAYHVYGCWWVDENTLHFYLDGEFVYTINPSKHFTEKPFNRPMYMHMVTETYNWETPPTPDELADDSKNTSYYDWVRAYVLESF